MKLDRVTYLDGLRGYAALSVVMHHCVLAFWPGLYGLKEPGPIPWWQVAIHNSPIPIIYNGTFAVYVFFVLSGFVLSVGFARTRDSESIQYMLARRHLRLAIPVLGSTLLCMTLWSLGAFDLSNVTISEWGKRFYTNKEAFTWAGALWDGLFGSIFHGNSRYNYVLWTMRIEFVGSIITFASCLLFRGFRFKRIIYATEAVILVYAVPKHGALYACFLSGMIVAESSTFKLKTIWAAILLTICVLLGSYHSKSEFHVFLRVMSINIGDFKLVPTQACYLIASTLLLIISMFWTPAAAFLSQSLSSWLGKISFSLYLTHSFVISTVGYFLVEHLRHQVAYNYAAFISTLAVMLFSLAVAAAFSPIDELAKYFSKRFSFIFLAPGQSVQLANKVAAASDRIDASQQRYNQL